MTKKLILVIDDELYARRVLENALARQGFDTLLAGSANQGYEMMLQQRVDAVTCDLVMPEVDGTEFIIRKNKNPYLRDIPVIVISGIGEPAMVQEALNEGAVTHVSKPFSETQLKNALIKALQSG